MPQVPQTDLRGSPSPWHRTRGRGAQDVHLPPSLAVPHNLWIRLNRKRYRTPQLRSRPWSGTRPGTARPLAVGEIAAFLTDSIPTSLQRLFCTPLFSIQAALRLTATGNLTLGPSQSRRLLCYTGPPADITAPMARGPRATVLHRYLHHDRCTPRVVRPPAHLHNSSALPKPISGF